MSLYVWGRSLAESKLPLKIPLEGSSLEAYMPTQPLLPVELEPQHCFFEHQISGWLAFRGQLVWKICFFKYWNPTQLCEMFTLWEAHWNDSEGVGGSCFLLFSLTLGMWSLRGMAGACVCLYLPPLSWVLVEFFWAETCMTWHHCSCCNPECFLM